MYEIILHLTFSLGLFATVILLKNYSERRLLNFLFSTFTLSMSVFSLLVFCIRRDWIPDYVFLIRTFIPLYYFLPPTIYLYARSFVRDETRLTRKDLWHLAPLGLHVGYSIPLVLDLAFGEATMQTLMNTASGSASFFNSGPIPNIIHDVFRLLVLGIYIVLFTRLFASRTFRGYIHLNRDIYPHSIRWIRYFMVVSVLFSVFAGVVKSQIYFLHDESIIFDGNVYTIFMLVFFDLLMAYAMLNPVILFGLPYFRKVMGQEISSHPSSDSLSVFPRYEDSAYDPAVLSRALVVVPEKTRTVALDPSFDERPFDRPAAAADGEMEKAERLIRMMNNHIETNQPHRNPDFNLTMLSVSLKVPEHHLSFIFRHILKKSFVEYRNELRVADVMRMLDHGAANSITMEAIGAEAGFNCRATFFSVFKKQTGFTTKQYLKFQPHPSTPLSQ